MTVFSYRRNTLIIFFKRLWKYSMTSNKLFCSIYRLFQKEYASRLYNDWLFSCSMLYTLYMKRPFESTHPSFRSLQRISLEVMFINFHISDKCVYGILTTLLWPFWSIEYSASLRVRFYFFSATSTTYRRHHDIRLGSTLSLFDTCSHTKRRKSTFSLPVFQR